MGVKILLVRALSKLTKIKPVRLANLMAQFKNDFKNEKRTSLKQKLWAYRRGFVSSNIINYGLNEENHKDYISDVDYAKIFPLNNQYVFWINDKLTTKYILSKYDNYLTRYYYTLKNNKVLASIDSPSERDLSVNSVVNLLEDKGRLAIKQEMGSLGAGFYRLEYNDNLFYINGKNATKNEVADLIRSSDGYLVTELIEAHKDIKKIYPGTPNTIRMMVIKDGNKSARLANALITFGTSETKGVDNRAAGGLFSIIDVQDGSFKTARREVNGKLEEHEYHPDTKELIKGELPKWKDVTRKVVEIANYINHLSWMGFDVIITDEGFKILEINSHQNVDWFQFSYPLLRDNPASNFLKKKLKEKSLLK